jgi:RNA polymerase sigma-70 factor (ECF subfamily)
VATVNLSDLVERARNEELPLDQQHAAFAELVRRFEESAARWAFELLDDPEEARDAAQDAFLTAWRKLRQVRDPAAFGAWLKRLVATQCNRRRRKQRSVDYNPTPPAEHDDTLANAISRLSEPHYRVVMMFYFLGRKIDEIAVILGIPRGTVGKRLHAARIAIRRNLPPAVRLLRPSAQFQQKVMEGLLDEYVGEYRFAERPDLKVKIEREGGLLISDGAGQRSVLVSMKQDALVTIAYDGEGRFERDRAGRIDRFVYYEFGARLGVAKKLSAEFASASSSL